MKLDELSSDLVKLIEQCLESQTLAKLLYYAVPNPYQQPTLVTRELAPYGSKERILPYPFDVNYKADQRSQLHMYFPSVAFKNNMVVEDTLVWIDIVVHKKLWLISNNGKKLIRPYVIAQEVVNALIDPCFFFELNHLSVNEEYDCLRIEGRIRNWTKSET